LRVVELISPVFLKLDVNSRVRLPIAFREHSARDARPMRD
jgi:hypothetical protein